MKLHPLAVASALVAATAILAAGCGGSGAGTGAASPASTTATGSPSDTATPSAAGSTAPTGLSTQPAGTGRCHTSMLSANVTMGSPGAGQRYANLVLTNSSGTTCRIYGFPGLQLVSASGAAIPTRVVRNAVTPRLVTVAPGAHVHSLLHWTVVPGAGETGSSCEPNPSGVKTTPPDETVTLSTAWPGGSVCQHGQIFVDPFKPGSGT